MQQLIVHFVLNVNSRVFLEAHFRLYSAYICIQYIYIYNQKYSYGIFMNVLTVIIMCTSSLNENKKLKQIHAGS